MAWCLIAASVIVLSAPFRGCRGTAESGIQITLTQYERLRDLESELPLPPDSIAARYERFDSAAFRSRYRDKLNAVCALIDSLDVGLPDSLRIDTLSIDHSFANLGEAARVRKSIFLSSSYFFLFDDYRVLRSVVFHEFGHLRYADLPAEAAADVDSIWTYLQHSSLLYLVRDGEYSGNARFGGHPTDNPTEMFASTYNLTNNRMEELRARLEYVDRKHLAVIQRLLRRVQQ